MTQKYPGGFVTLTPPTQDPALGAATPGIWTLDQALAAEVTRSWPMYDPYYKNVVLNLHGEGTNGAQNNTFLDSSTNNFTITRNGNTTQGSFSPYGQGWSNYFSSSTASGPSTHTVYAGSSEDFTFECWFNLSAISTDNMLMGWNKSPTWDYIDINATGYNVNMNNSYTVSGTKTWAAGTWYHFAVSRTSNVVKVYIDGVLNATVTNSNSIGSSSTAFRIGNWYTTPAKYFNGYVSNLRWIKGTGLYSSSCTPSTTPLTAISGTSLLTCQSNRFIDNSTNAYEITPSGSTSVQRFQPFLFNTSYTPSTIGGSGYFDGTGDYLEIPYSSALDASTGPFTYECWLYPNTTTNKQYLGGSVTGAFFAFVGSGTIFVGRNNIAVDFTSSADIQINQWNHVVIVRNSSNNIAIFINGVSAYYAASNTNNYGLASNPLRIGVATTGSSYEYSGYINDVKVAKSALYDPTASTITVPTTPLTAGSAGLLANFTNGAIYDNAMMNDLETVGNAQISTSVKKYGTGSMYFDGTGDYLKGVPTSLQSLTGDFTIECWLYYTAHGTYGGVVSCANSNILSPPASGWAFVFYSTTDKLYFETGTGFSLQTTNTIPSSQWNHVAVVRSGSTITHYLNGVANGSGTSSSAFNVSSTDNFVIGIDRGLTNTLTGYIDDLRITKGVARYVANFTPPTSQLQDQ